MIFLGLTKMSAVAQRPRKRSGIKGRPGSWSLTSWSLIPGFCFPASPPIVPKR